MRANNFDAIRLFMALLVVWSHSFALFLGSEEREPISLLFNGSYNAGNFAVLAFFVISGFLITHSFVRSKSVGVYLMRRVRRIYPGYLVATTICAFVVVPLFSTMYNRSAFEALRVVAENLVLRGAVPASTVFAANRAPNIVNGSLWSIPFEFWCYIGVALLGVTKLLPRRNLVLALLATTLLTRVGLDLLGRKPALGLIGDIFGWPYLWVQVLPCFLLGMVAYLYQDRIPRSRLLALGLVAAALVAAHAGPHLVHLVAPVALAYLVLHAAFSPTIRLHHAARFGDFSYGAYLYAFPIQQMLFAAYGYTLPVPELFALSMVLSLAAGVVSWHTVERWFLNRNAKRKAPLDEEAKIVAP